MLVCKSTLKFYLNSLPPISQIEHPRLESVPVPDAFQTAQPAPATFLYR